MAGLPRPAAAEAGSARPSPSSRRRTTPSDVSRGCDRHDDESEREPRGRIAHQAPLWLRRSDAAGIQTLPNFLEVIEQIAGGLVTVERILRETATHNATQLARKQRGRVGPKDRAISDAVLVPSNARRPLSIS